MDYAAFCDEWYKQHPLAKILDEKDNEWDHLHTIIVQKLDWLQYCSQNNMIEENSFVDSLFNNLLLALSIDAESASTIQFGGFIDLFNLVSKAQAEVFDLKLLGFVNDLLHNLQPFETMYNLYLTWTRMRLDFLSKVNLGLPSAEAAWIPAHYTARRGEFLHIRNTKYHEMRIMGEYFLGVYAHCKAMDRLAMAGDIISVHDFVLKYLRDLLASARSNGFDEYEEKIKQLIELLQSETEDTPAVFISYSWDDTEIADKIERSITGKAIIHRDKNDVRPGDNIETFMRSIRKQDFIILVVSPKYLESRNCMFEVLQMLKDYDEDEEALWDKVMIFVSATNIYDRKGRAQIVSYWAKECQKIFNEHSALLEMREVGLLKEARMVHYIFLEIDKLLNHISEVLCDGDIDEFIDHINTRLDQWHKYGKTPIEDILIAGNALFTK